MRALDQVDGPPERVLDDAPSLPGQTKETEVRESTFSCAQG